MSVIKVALKADGRQIKQTFTGSWVRTTTRSGDSVSVVTTPIKRTSGQIVYGVLTSSPNDLPIAILSDGRLPQLGASYCENGIVYTNVYYADATPRYVGPRGAYYEWEVSYTIGGEFANADQNDGEDTETLTSFSLSMEREEYASLVDLDGQWNCNSLGEFFADPIVFQTGIATFTYQRKEYANPLWKCVQFWNAHNAATWHGFAPGTVKASEIVFSANQTQSGTTYDVTYKLQYRPRGWGVDKANAGYYENVSGTLARVLNEDGSPAEAPALLALDGTRLVPGAAPIMKTFRTTVPADFNLLNLPDPGGL